MILPFSNFQSLYVVLRLYPSHAPDDLDVPIPILSIPKSERLYATFTVSPSFFLNAPALDLKTHSSVTRTPRLVSLRFCLTFESARAAALGFRSVSMERAILIVPRVRKTAAVSGAQNKPCSNTFTHLHFHQRLTAGLTEHRSRGTWHRA